MKLALQQGLYLKGSGSQEWPRARGTQPGLFRGVEMAVPLVSRLGAWGQSCS